MLKHLKFSLSWQFLCYNYLVVLCTILRRFLLLLLLFVAVIKWVFKNASSLSCVSDDWQLWLGLFTVSTEGDEFKDEGMREFKWKVEAIDDNDDGGGLVFPSSFFISMSHAFEQCRCLLIWIGLTQSDGRLCSLRIFVFLLLLLDEGLKVGRLDVDGERRLANITPLTPPPPHVLNIENRGRRIIIDFPVYYFLVLINLYKRRE